MNSHDFEQNLTRGLRDQHIHTSDVTAEWDPQGGWMLRVISADFKKLSVTERRRAVAQAIGDERLTWRQYLTSDEVKEAAPMPSVELSTLPLWPESLARGRLQLNEGEKPVVFVSDVDDDLHKPVTATFYSLRGGVGRSTALAHTARLLARQGKKVVCLDMDLEAPGLAALFNVQQAVQHEQGVVHLLMSLDQGGSPDFPDHLIPIDDEGHLFLIPAGIPDADYARDLSLLDPTAWYSEQTNPLQQLLEGARTKLPFTPDVILMDSRTGISAISAPLLFEQADLAIVALFPHEQARQGTEALIQGLMVAQNYRRLTCDKTICAPDIRFLVGPLPDTRQLNEMLYNRALGWIADWLAPAQASRRQHGYPELMEDELTHQVPYREAIAGSRNVQDVDEIESLYSTVAGWIDGLLPLDEAGGQSGPFLSDKSTILRDVRIDPGTAEHQDDFFSVFMETETIRRALQKDSPLVLGRKGTGKTALFRHVVQGGGPERDNVLPLCRPRGYLNRAL